MGSLYTDRMECVLALVQRLIDSARNSHSRGRNLPKTAPDLAEPSVIAEEIGQAGAKTTGLAPEKRAWQVAGDCRMCQEDKRKQKTWEGEVAISVEVAEREGWAKEESVHKWVLLSERKLRILWDYRCTDSRVGGVW